MNFVKALKIYNDKQGNTNGWVVYKKGTPEYLEVMKIMNENKKEPKEPKVKMNKKEPKEPKEPKVKMNKTGRPKGSKNKRKNE
jgi:hypothetical protein